VNNRPAFLLSAGLIVLVMLVSIGAFLLVLHGFVAEIAPTIPDVMTDIPTLYDYNVNGTKITEFDGLNSSEVEAEYQRLTAELEELLEDLARAEESASYNQIPQIKVRISALEKDIADLNYQGFTQPNQRLEMYWMFAYPVLAISFIFIMFAAATYYWEKGFSIFQRGTSIGIIKTSIIGIVVIILLPEFWDIYAIHMKQFALYLIDPFSRQPAALVRELWCEMGCLFDPDDYDAFSLTDVGSIILGDATKGSTIISDVLLPIFKIVPVTMITITFFVIAKIRALFIIVIIISLPIWMVCMNIPILKKISNEMLTNMIGASIAPIFSAITLSVGLGYLGTTSESGFNEWISALGIAIFASLWPVLLAPKLSIIAHTATSAVQTSIQSTAMFASNMAGSIGKSVSGGNSGNSGNSNDNDDLRKYT